MEIIMDRKKQRKLAFKKLAERRTQRAIDSMSLLTNLANRSNYEYQAEDVKKIIEALRDAIKAVENEFSKPLQKNKNFKL